MRNCSFLFLVLCCAPLAFSQAAATPPPTPGQTAPAAPSTDSSKPHGPEAVASADPNRVVATVDGKQITAKQALDMLKPFPPEQRKQYESNLPNLIQQIYMRVQLADLATKENLDQQSPWKDQIALSKENVLAQAYLTQLSENATKNAPEDPQKYYDAHPDEFDQVKLSGIFISFTPPGTPAPAAGSNARTEQQAEDKANDVEKQLKAGGDFAALARSESDNQATSTKGGELGTFSMGDQLPPPLRTAIGKLQPGQYSEPVRVQNSLLIVKLDSRKQIPFAEAKSTIEQKLKTEQGQNAVKQVVDKYKIKVEDPDFFAGANSRNIPTLQRPGSSATPPPPAKQ